MEAWWMHPGWFIIIVVLGTFFALLLGILVILFPKKDRQKEREASQELASKIAASPQYVVRVKRDPKITRIELRSNDTTDESLFESVLWVEPCHPDYRRIRYLEHLCIIEFEFHQEGIPKVNEQDASAYLRLKKHPAL